MRLSQREMNDPAVWRTHVGRKASMRLRNHGDPNHPFTERIGVIQSVEDETLTVVSRRGDTHTEAIGDVLAAKIF